ncbi:hypothetical protein D3C85_1320290 [compost metagenome]
MGPHGYIFDGNYGMRKTAQYDKQLNEIRHPFSHSHSKPINQFPLFRSSHKEIDQTRDNKQGYDRNGGPYPGVPSPVVQQHRD